MKKHEQTHSNLGFVVRNTLMWRTVPFIPTRTWDYLKGKIVGDLSRKVAKCLKYQLEDK